MNSRIDATLSSTADATVGSTVDSTLESAMDSIVPRCPYNAEWGALPELWEIERGYDRAGRIVLSIVLSTLLCTTRDSPVVCTVSSTVNSIAELDTAGTHWGAPVWGCLVGLQCVLRVGSTVGSIVGSTIGQDFSVGSTA